MKPFLKSILSLSLFILSVTVVQAATPITGYLEGENLGVIHMDYSTGVNPGLADPAYFVGNRNDFYIDLDDAAFTGPGSAGNVTTISNVGEVTEMCSDTETICMWNDFAWSPRIGWVAFDGEEIQNTAGMGVLNFPDAYFPHITYTGLVNGFAWGATTGWIALSACAGLDETTCNTLPSLCSWDTGLSACEFSSAPVSQNEIEWGVSLDLNTPTDIEAASCEDNNQAACLLDSNCSWNGASCEFGSTPRGRFFEGFAWSEHLGWIGFENAATTWINDPTEPELNIDAVSGDHLWFSNESATGQITWADFAQDAETGIDTITSSLNALLDSSVDFNGCYNGPGDNGVGATFAEAGNGVDVFFPSMGNLTSADYGFCKYTLTGEIKNGSGISFYIGNPNNSLSPEILADPAQYREAITIYTFAGEYDPSNSIATDTGDGTELADGSEIISAQFSPKDLAGNPIFPVRVGQNVDTSGGNIVFENTESNWMRDVELAFNFENNAYFDSIDPTQTPSNSPIILSDTDPINAGTTYTAGMDGSYPNGGIATLLPSNNQYNLQAISFAPTQDTFRLSDLDFRLITAELPAITTLVSATPASTLNYSIDENTVLSGVNPLPLSFNFQSPLSISNTGLNEENLVIGKPIELSYDVTNESTQNVNYLALDHEFNFYNVGGGGFGEEVLEIRGIESTSAADGVYGQTDLASGLSRYAFLNATPSGLNSSLNDTVFFSSSGNHHNNVYNFKYDLSNTPSSLDTNGVYNVEGSFYGLGSDLEIDRADFAPNPSPFIPSGNTITPIFSLTPVQIEGLGFSQQVEFELSHHYLAYRMENAPPSFTEFAVYENPNPLTGIQVQNIGLNTTGLVSGEQIYQSIGGRTLSTVSTAASLGLQKEINRNVAQLTRNISPCSANTILMEFSIDTSPCIQVDETNKTVVAYYQGMAGELLTFGNAAGTLTVPNDYRYTVIVEGGADVFLRDNLSYGNTRSAFGLIVFKNNANEGGNVYLDPYPTNMVGLLYAEGSLLSSPDGSTFYYGDTGNVTELKNQLYWQGKVASRNTLGGGPNLTVPPGISCGNTVETLECAQRYDLDYLRRFTTVNTVNGDYSLNNGKFSGDGSCDDAIPECIYPGVLPKTVTLNVNNLIEVSASKSIDPVYIDPDVRPIPLGFSKEIDVSQGSVVR